MIFQVRRWRLTVRSLALIITGMLMLVFAAPASYALQDDTPKPLYNLGQLFDKDRPLTDKYVYTTTAPKFSEAVTTEDFGKTYYWVPLPGYYNQLFLRAEDKNFIETYQCLTDPTGAGTNNLFYGKLTSMQNMLGADEVVKELEAQGITVDKEKAMVLLHGEQPKTYRPIVPVWGVLALLWVAAFVGLLKIWLGRPRQRRSRRPAPAMGR